MLACTAMLVGCSDDAIDNIAQENNELNSDVKGYLSIAISANTSSSRGLMDNANGDGDGTVDDSGHYNAGTADENKVNSILVVIKSTKTTGGKQYAKLYAPTDASTTYDIENDFTKVNEFYTMKDPFEVELDTYKPLVIINPNDGIKGLMNSGEISVDGTTGLVSGDLYTAICNYSVNPIVSTGTRNATTLAAAQKLVAGDNYNSFMMANRTDEVEIKVTTQNTGKDNAAGRDEFIEVERAISKITFRPTILDGVENLYKVPFTHYQITGVKKTIGETTYIKYVTTNGTEVWSADGGKTFYTISDETATEVGNDISTEGAEVYYERTENTVETNWYVKLNRYALINLSKDLYAVRHAGTNDYTDNSGIDVMKILTASTGNYPYLVDPVSTAKNNVSWTEAGDWDDNYPYNDWFFNSWNTVQNVIAATEGYTLDLDWANLVDGTANDPQGVTGKDHKDFATENGTYSEIGKHLTYCFENAVKRTNAKNQELQTAGLSTAIVFEAQIYEKNDAGTLVNLTTPLYQYQGSLFTSIADIKTLHGLTGGAWDEESPSDTELEALGVKIYKSGKCYYYTSQIKHFADKDNTYNNVMEFAIMRNNIYSLAVTGIKNIGDADLSGFTPAEPDESKTAYIQVNAEILPWIVRFTDVEF